MKAIHGGDIYRNSVKLDFSVNGNPMGIPETVRRALLAAVDTSTCYPDPEAEGLRNAVVKRLDVPPSFLVFGNGASELLLAAVHALRPRRTVIPVPSFFGYEHAAAAWDGQIFYYEMQEKRGFVPEAELLQYLTEETDMLFLANPNNPVGNLLPQKQLVQILEHCLKQKIHVVLDECFIDFCRPGSSALPLLRRYPNLLILRAYTKIYAIPGVRLGYAVCADPVFLSRIRRQLPEWNLSGFAQAAGRACAEEKDYVTTSRDYIRRERAFLQNRLEALGIRVFPGEADFLLIASPIPLYEELLKQEILIRDCSNFRGMPEGYYRIGVRTHEENVELIKAIGGIICTYESKLRQ